MNSKRRADLQRKLSMGSVPKPPADLAERIKADIPLYLQPAPAPPRFAWPTVFRVAASLMMLLTTAIVTMRVMEPVRKEVPVAAAARQEKVVPAILQYDHTRTTADSATAPRAEAEVELTIEEPLPLPRIAPPPPPQMARAQEGFVEARRDAGAREEDDAEAGAALSANDSVAEAQPRQAETIATTASAPMLEAAEAAPAPAPAPAPVPPPPMPASAPAAAAGRLAPQRGVYAPELVPKAHAADLKLEAPDSVFGISIDPSVFQSIKTAIENGTRPDTRNVNIDAVVNYFAGPPARPPRRGVSLEVEASPAAVHADGDQAILRFTVDTPRADMPQRGSALPVAKEARITIDVDSRAVASIDRIGGANAIPAEAVLLQNTSVTGLYELELKPRLRSSQRIATVRLQYRSVQDGRLHTVERVIFRRDLAKSWTNASRRHRLASLGALWTQTLAGSSDAIDVAKRANELATQNPGDVRARDLATAANATTGGGR